MFFPYGDTPNPGNYRPWVTWGLIALNVLVYFVFTMPLEGRAVNPDDPVLEQYLRVMMANLPTDIDLRQILNSISAYDLFVFKHGYKPGAPSTADLFTSMFMHGGLMHLAGNMLYLYIYGDNVEHRLGRGLFLVVYLLTGVAATLAFAIFAHNSMIPLVGASGAISGVLGLYFLMFKDNRIKVFVLFFPFIMTTWLVSARWVLGFYLFFDNVLPFLAGSASGVAHGAHIGGFVAGLAIAALFGKYGRRLLRKRRPRVRVVPDPESSDSGNSESGPAKPGPGDKPRAVPSDLVRLRSAMSAGSAEESLEILRKMGPSAAESLGPAECAVLAGWLQDAGYKDSAGGLLKRCLATHPGSNDLARIFLGLGLVRIQQGAYAAATQHLLAVFDHNPDEITAARAKRALEGIEQGEQPN